jgi:hypothetical protein
MSGGDFTSPIYIDGAPLLPGGGGQIYTGNVKYVDSGNPDASDSPSAGTATEPYLTMHYANTQMTANNGDLVIVKPGHIETVTAAAGLVLNTAGVTWHGVGSGSDRPTVNFTTVVGADMDVDAANVTMYNFLFTGGIDALTGPIDVNAADFKLVNCETKDVTGQATDFIVTDANADRLLIDGWTHRGAAAAGADTAITIVGGDGATIRNFWIDGNFAVACIENVTTAATNLTIGGFNANNYARTRNAADVIVTLVATATANVGPNIAARLQDDAANITEAFVGADAQFFQPIEIVNADGESSMQTNITASTDA